MLFKKSGMRGLTVIEIMFILLIMSIIVSVMVGIGNSSANKAREAGVRSDIKNYLDLSEIYLTSDLGFDMSPEEFNSNLSSFGDKDIIDPWKNLYNISFENGSTPNSAKITFITPGKNSEITYDSFGRVDSSKNFMGVSYYHEGRIARCTLGFGNNEVNTVYHVFNTPDLWVCGDSID